MKETKNWYRYGLFAAVILALGLTMRWIFPVALPFLVGFLVAWAAEPLTKTLCQKGKMPRALGSGIAITLSYALLLGLLWGLGKLAMREMDSLSRALPSLMEDLGEAAEEAEAWLLNLAGKAPERLRDGLRQNIRGLFSGTNAVTGSLSAWILGFATRLLGSLPDAFVFLGTAITASFLISVRFPAFYPWLTRRLPEAVSQKILPILYNLRGNFGLWLRAECKMTLLTFVLLTAGFFFLRIPNAVLLGAAVSLVDALPILGTGTVLVPWAAFALLRGNSPLGLGLLAMYVILSLTRSFLEPRLIGRQLGMNPLLTLGAVYLGYRFWGIFGMILAPILSVTVMDLWAMGSRNV